VREVASEHGVRIAKWLGDGAMFVSTEGPALVSAIIALQRQAAGEVHLPIRAGVSGGDVILFEGDDYIGGPVNLAARLSDVAAPGEVLASADMAAFVPEEGAARAVDPRLVPGFMQPVPIVAIGAAEPISDTHEVIAG
jgi:adenylate cyclase